MFVYAMQLLSILSILFLVAPYILQNIRGVIHDRKWDFHKDDFLLSCSILCLLVNGLPPLGI